MFLFRLFTCLIVVAAVNARPIEGETRKMLEYRPAPVDNPLKGLVPYQGDARSKFPHAMEFNYLPYSALVKGYDNFDWKPLEELLNDVASRGHQAIFRVYLEYPGKSDVIPEFLIEDGLKVYKYPDTNTQSPAPTQIQTPDYENANLRLSLSNFIAALGKKYDGDPRIGFITAGLLGAWGEWHNYPREELFASKEVQIEVMNAYEAAFKITPVLLRYPAGENDEQYANNSNRRFGYHDDSFAWATLYTGKQGDEWFYLSKLKASGPGALTKWKTHPIGGEIRPEAWGRVFDQRPETPEIQNFRRCVEETHVTWLMDSGMFEEKQKADRIERARIEVQRMGYEFHAAAVTLGDVDNGELNVALEIENRGVAPFYYDWQPEYGLLGNKNVVKTFRGCGKLTGLLPGDKPRIWSDKLNLTGIDSGSYMVAVRIPNPLKGGAPVRFANATQDADAPTWLSLGVVMIP